MTPRKVLIPIVVVSFILGSVGINLEVLWLALPFSFLAFLSMLLLVTSEVL